MSKQRHQVLLWHIKLLCKLLPANITASMQYVATDTYSYITGENWSCDYVASMMHIAGQPVCLLHMCGLSYSSNC